jgi:hypothetical protein
LPIGWRAEPVAIILHLDGQKPVLAGMADACAVIA